MGLSVSASVGYSFENKENLRQAARNILLKQGSSSEFASKFLEQTIFMQNNKAETLQASVLNTSTQITLNNSLKETLKYLQTHANDKKVKKYVLGEIWSILETINEDAEENQYSGELLDFVIDKDAKNIFAA